MAIPHFHQVFGQTSTDQRWRGGGGGKPAGRGSRAHGIRFLRHLGDRCRTASDAAQSTAPCPLPRRLVTPFAALLASSRASLLSSQKEARTLQQPPPPSPLSRRASTAPPGQSTRGPDRNDRPHGRATRRCFAGCFRGLCSDGCTLRRSVVRAKGT